MSEPLPSGPEALVRSFMLGPYPDDPYPLYDALREQAPVYCSDIGLAFTSSYESCLTVLRDPRLGQGAGAQRLRDDDRFETSPRSARSPTCSRSSIRPITLVCAS